jgi:hypothetical protein
MIDHSTINKVAKEVAAEHLGSGNVAHVTSESTIDSEGQDALRITIVIRDDALGRLTGDAALDTLVQMQDRLRKVGEDRFAIVEYATENELDAVADSEP